MFETSSPVPAIEEVPKLCAQQLGPDSRKVAEGLSEGWMMDICLYPNTKSKRPKTLTRPLPYVLQLLTAFRTCEAKEDAHLFLLATFADPESEGRKLAGLSTNCAIVGDIDEFDAKNFERGVKTLGDNGFTAVCYETYNSSPESPRWRVVVLLDTPISKSDYNRCWAALNDVFGGCLDPAARDASRLSYLPSHPPGASRRAFIIGAPE